VYLIGRDYREGITGWHAARLAAELDIPGSSLAPVLSSLAKAGLIVASERVASEREHFLPGRDPEKIRISSVIEAARATPHGRVVPAGRAAQPAARVMQEVESALARNLGERSLKDMIAGQ
jgi:DNA-binding IscR family transcriptional regulator